MDWSSQPWTHQTEIDSYTVVKEGILGGGLALRVMVLEQDFTDENDTRIFD